MGRLPIKLTSLHHLPTAAINGLKSIRDNDSMRPQYESIFNQCIVLSVSHFTSAIHSIFVDAIDHACCCCPELLTATKEDIKISFDELKAHGFDLTEGLGELVIKKKNVSFQDMKSTSRSFKSFLDIDLEKDRHVNNIIVGQAARHAIVHASGLADEKFIKQIEGASPRDIKTKVNIGQPIQFTTEEIETIQASMTAYIDDLIGKISNRILDTNSLYLEPENEKK